MFKTFKEFIDTFKNLVGLGDKIVIKKPHIDIRYIDLKVYNCSKVWVK